MQDDPTAKLAERYSLEACIRDARSQMEALNPADFVAEGKVVYATASRPA